MPHHPLTTLPRLEASVTGFALRLHENNITFEQQLFSNQKPDPESGLRDTPARSIIPSACLQIEAAFPNCPKFSSACCAQRYPQRLFTSEKK